MRILAINTATEACSAAIWDNGTIYSYNEICPQKHAQRILFLIKEILQCRDLSLKEIDALAFSRGPGNFNSVRIGIGISQGLALGADIPMIGISSLATIAQGAWRNTRVNKVLSAIDANIGEIYWSEYIRNTRGIWQGEKNETILKPEVINNKLKELSGKWATAGTGWKKWPSLAEKCNIDLCESNTIFPVAEDMLPIALYFLSSKKIISVEKAEPSYLRNTVC